MEAKKFERKNREYIGEAFLVLLILSIMSFILSLLFDGFDVLATVVIRIELFATMMLLLISLCMPPDFMYTIRKRENDILFEFGLNDVRTLKKNFRIFSQNKRYLILQDGDSRIKIAYNDAVLKFLQELGA